jgi:hypothetical protein
MGDWFGWVVLAAALGGAYWFLVRPTAQVRKHAFATNDRIAALWNRQVELVERQNEVLERIAKALETRQND